MGHQRIHTEKKNKNPVPIKKTYSKSNAETLDAFPLKLGMGNMLVFITVCLDLEIFTSVVVKISCKYWKGKCFHAIVLAEQKRFWNTYAFIRI